MPLGGYNIVDRRPAVKQHHKGKLRKVRDRDVANVDGITMHSMGFDWGTGLTSYDGVDAHYAVLRNGTILWLHDHGEYLNASGRLNSRTVSVEFAGNPVSVRGKAFNEAKFGRHIPTVSQVMGGRSLLKMLKELPGIRLAYVFAHCQADWPGRSNCPGPHVWYNVGEWGRKQLSLSDGGPGFFVQGGHEIPAKWRDSSYDVTCEDLFSG